VENGGEELNTFNRKNAINQSTNQKLKSSMKKSSIAQYLLLLLICCAISCKNAKEDTVKPKPRFPIAESDALQEVPGSSVVSEPEVKLPETNKINHISVDFLNSLLKISNEKITGKLAALDGPYWEYVRKTPKSIGHIWENKRAGQTILKMSNGDISLLDYGPSNMKNYAFLKEKDANHQVDKNLGHTYFDYEGRFIQWKKIPNNGTMMNIVDMDF
jgi:hypothetical protein